MNKLKAMKFLGVACTVLGAVATVGSSVAESYIANEEQNEMKKSILIECKKMIKGENEQNEEQY